MLDEKKGNPTDIKDIVIVSLGQLIHSDIKKSFTAFGDMFREQNFSFPGIRVLFAYCLDVLWYKTINSYKRGDIKFEEFHKRICSQLGIQISEEKFRNAWNAMCEVNEKTVNGLNEVINLQRANPFVLSIISFTNQCQYDHILNSLKARGLDLITAPNVTVTTSFEKHECSFKKLAASSVLNYDEAGKTVISLNNQITSAEKLDVHNAHFEYHKFNGKESSLAGTIKNAIIAKQTSHVDRLNSQRTQSNNLCIVQ